MFNQSDLRVVSDPANPDNLYVEGVERFYIVRRWESQVYRSHF